MKAAAASQTKPSGSLSTWVLVGMLLLVAAMIAQAPASLLKKAMPAGSALQVDAWGGTLWNGQVNWRQGDLQGQAAWQIHAWQLLLGRVTADVQTSGDLSVSGKVSLHAGGAWAVDELSGHLPASFIKPFLPQGWNLPGDLQADRLTLGRAKLKKAAWQQAGGRLTWPGGPMTFSVNGQAENATLPPLQLNLRLDNDTLALALQEQSGSLGLAGVRIGPDDMMETQIRQRLLEFGPGYHGSGSPDDVTVTAKQPL